jgi:hypothetical protein
MTSSRKFTAVYGLNLVNRLQAVGLADKVQLFLRAFVAQPNLSERIKNEDDLPKLIAVLKSGGLRDEVRSLIYDSRRPEAFRVLGLKNLVLEEIRPFLLGKRGRQTLFLMKRLCEASSADTVSALVDGFKTILKNSDDRTEKYDSSPLLYQAFHRRRSPEIEALYRRIGFYLLPSELSPESMTGVGDSPVMPAAGAFAFGSGGAGAPAGGGAGTGVGGPGF